eukprot:9843274-Alexandrium_andersonii.AAC.1
MVIWDALLLLGCCSGVLFGYCPEAFRMLGFSGASGLASEVRRGLVGCRVQLSDVLPGPEPEPGRALHSGRGGLAQHPAEEDCGAPPGNAGEGPAACACA